MSWKKYFKTVNTSPLTNTGPNSNSDVKFSNYASSLPEVYTGHANRITRYAQYENMDVDSEVNAAVDILKSNLQTGIILTNLLNVLLRFSVIH